MFDKLQKRWKVGPLEVLLILAIFTIGGSFCGFLTKKIMDLIPLSKGLIWWILYVLIATIIWPICVLVVSIPLGQFKFFKNYTGHIIKRISGKRVNDEQD